MIRLFLGHDGLPVDQMAGLDLNGMGDNSIYGGVSHGHALDNSQSPLTTPSNGNLNNYNDDLPSPPQDNNQVAAWYDTDL